MDFIHALNNPTKKLVTMILVLLTLLSILFTPYSSITSKYKSDVSSMSSFVSQLFGGSSSNAATITKCFNDGNITLVEYQKINKALLGSKSITDALNSSETYQNIALNNIVVFIFIVFVCVLCGAALFFLLIENPKAKLLLNVYFGTSVGHLLFCMYFNSYVNDQVSILFSKILNVGITGFLSCILSVGAIILWKSYLQTADTNANIDAKTELQNVLNVAKEQSTVLVGHAKKHTQNLIDKAGTLVKYPCEHCQAPVSAEDKFCPKCGQTNVPPPVNMCNKCQKKLGKTVTFCPDCGTPGSNPGK